MVAEGLQLLGDPQQAEKSIHFSYEMVTLSPKTAIELGFTLSEDEQKRSFVEMSGRKGLGVKADDLLDRLESRGLVRREPSARDRRVKVLHLTPTGARLRAQLLRQISEADLPLSRLSLEQRRTLVKILESLVDEE